MDGPKYGKRLKTQECTEYKGSVHESVKGYLVDLTVDVCVGSNDRLGSRFGGVAPDQTRFALPDASLKTYMRLPRIGHYRQPSGGARFLIFTWQPSVSLQ